MDLNPSSVAYWLHDLEQVPSTLSLSLHSHKMGITLVPKLLLGCYEDATK